MPHPNVVYAIHNFEAENEDEITFQFGEPIIILEKDDQFMDGWWQGRNVYGQIGLFPMNYTSPEKPSLSRISSYKKEYNERLGNTEVYRRTSDSTISSGATDSTEKLVHKNEKANNESTGLSHKSPSDWSVEEVITWLESAGLEIVVENFIDQEISGDVLLNLTHEGLKELGINTYGRRYRVINAIENLKRSYSEEYNNYNNRASPGKLDIHRCSPMTDTLSNIGNISLKSPIFPKSSSFSFEEASYRSSVKPNFLRSHDSLNTTLTRSTISNSRSTISADKKSSLGQRNTIDQYISNTDGSYQYVDIKNESPELEGWMYKQSERLKTWNKRWFILHDSNLIYFKNPKDTRAKGIIRLSGYKVIPDNVSPNGKKYSFKLHHERDKDFHFYTEDPNEMKNWTQALMKSTIKRDICMPVVSSSNQYTVPLDIAQKMKPRPPSIIMYKKNTDKKPYSLPSLIQTEELDETLLWMESPHTSEDQPQSLIIKSYASSYDDQEEEEEFHYEHTEAQSDDYTTLLNTRQWYESHLLEWVNFHLERKIDNLSQSFCSGEVLLELLESVSGQTIDYTTRSPTKSMEMLDNIVEAFKFMNQIGIEENEYSIKDIFSGNKDKIIDMLITIKDWSETMQ